MILHNFVDIEHIEAILAGKEEISISEGDRQAIRSCFTFLESFARDEVIYGINTGFGSMAQWRVLFDILDNIPDVDNYIVEVFTNSLGTDQIQIRIGSNNHSETFIKQIKDIFRSKVRVAPDIKFESAELISRLQMPPMSRKVIKFFDLRHNNTL